MKPEIVIFGTGDFGQVAACYFDQESPYRVVAFAVDADQLDERKVLGRPVVSADELPTAYPPDRVAGVFVAVGYRRVNQNRREIAERMTGLGYSLVSFLSPRAHVTEPVSIGAGTFILEGNVLQPFASIGAGVVLWSGNHVGHHSTIEDYCFVSSHVVIAGRARIGTQSFLGINATIADHVSVGARNIVGAGSLITRDTDEGEVFRPARTAPARVRSQKLWK